MNGPIFRLPPYCVEMTADAVPEGERVDWGLVAYGVPDAWKHTRGKGVRVAVLDTGVGQHKDLDGQVKASHDFTGSTIGAGDHVGHGTHVAGIVAAAQNADGVVGVAPDAELIIAKVLGDDGSGRMEWILNGIDWAIDQKPHVISMSLGSPGSDPWLHKNIQRAVAAGVFVICAAGNSGPGQDSVDYPGRYDEVLAIAAIDKAGKIADFSSRGPQVDFAAPGVSILSTYPRDRFARLSGTSMACPFVAGIVALMVSRHLELGDSAHTPLKTLSDVIEHLKRFAADVGPGGLDPASGHGVVDVGKLIEAEKAKNGGELPDSPLGSEVNLGLVKLHIPARAGDRIGLAW